MKRNALPRPHPPLLMLMIAALLALAPGILKGEAALLLASAVLIAAAALSFAAVFAAALFYLRRPFQTEITAQTAENGMSAARRVLPAAPDAFRHEARRGFCFARYRLVLHTAPPSGGLSGGKRPAAGGLLKGGGKRQTAASSKAAGGRRGGRPSGRSINALFPPAFFTGQEMPFAAPLRGAYYGAEDELVIFDTFGFWESRLAVPQPRGVRLLVPPAPPACRPPDFRQGADSETESGIKIAHAGGDYHDSRAYIPGDDPRLINWKLYGHLNELFVRERDRERSVHAVLALILDPSCDPALFPAAGGCTEAAGGCADAAGISAADAAVDALCSAVLSLARRALSSGLAVRLIQAAYPAAEAPEAPEPAADETAAGMTGEAAAANAGCVPDDASSAAFLRGIERRLAYPVPLPLEAGGGTAAIAVIAAIDAANEAAGAARGANILFAALPRVFKEKAPAPAGAAAAAKSAAAKSAAAKSAAAKSAAAPAPAGGGGQTVLDAYLAARKTGVQTELIFVVPESIHKERVKRAAEANVLYYGSKEGVYASSITA